MASPRAARSLPVTSVPRGRPYTRCPRCTWAAVVGERAGETRCPCIGSVVRTEAVGGPPAAAGVRAEKRHGRRRRGGRRAGKREPSGPRAAGAEAAGAEAAGAEAAACLGERRSMVLGAAVAAQPQVAGSMAAWQAAARRAASGGAGEVGGMALPSRGRACAVAGGRGNNKHKQKQKPPSVKPAVLGRIVSNRGVDWWRRVRASASSTAVGRALRLTSLSTRSGGRRGGARERQLLAFECGRKWARKKGNGFDVLKQVPPPVAATVRE